MCQEGTLPKLQTKSKPPLPLVFYHLSFLFLEHRLTGSVWIELIVAETKNWKYYSKIIFKWVNSTVGSIFNIFFINKVVVGPINSTATVLLQYHYSIICPILYAKRVKWKKKKKKWRNTDARRKFQPNPNGTWIFNFPSQIQVNMDIFTCVDIFNFPSIWYDVMFSSCVAVQVTLFDFLFGLIPNHFPFRKKENKYK